MDNTKGNKLLVAFYIGSVCCCIIGMYLCWIIGAAITHP